jgi:hypothetical protein
MRYFSRRSVGNEISRAAVMFSAVGAFFFAPALFANDKPTEVPAEVVAHLPLKEATGSEMLLQSKGDKQYLYVQKASKQGYMVVDVTKPAIPALLNVKANGDATAGTLQMAGPDAAIAEIPDKNSKGILHGTENPTATVKLLDLTDPAHPKVIRTFSGVTGTLQDPTRALIYLANNDGLWILRHSRPALAPARIKKRCSSEDALAAMPPDCQ